MKKIGIGIVVLVTCILVVCVMRKPKEEKKTKATTETIATEDETMTEAPTEATTEEYTEAPHDTSDWESQKPADTSPDTGAPIE